jgi:hypothetical protein
LGEASVSNRNINSTCTWMARRPAAAASSLLFGLASLGSKVVASAKEAIAP